MTDAILERALLQSRIGIVAALRYGLERHSDGEVSETEVEAKMDRAADYIDALCTALIARTERMHKLEEALRWYGEKASSMSRYMTAKPPRDNAIVAIATEMSLDAGNRALAALQEDGK